MLWLMCRDFQVEFWSFYLKNCVCHVKEYGLTCSSHVRLTCSIQKLCYMFYCTRFYTLYHTHFTCSTIHILPYTFSETADRNWNCKGVKLPSGCVVPGSWSFHTFGCCFVNWRGGLMRWTISGFLVLLGWAPSQVGTGLVKLASLSSKSICNLCVAFGVQGAVLASAFLCPVCCHVLIDHATIAWL